MEVVIKWVSWTSELSVQTPSSHEPTALTQTSLLCINRGSGDRLLSALLLWWISRWKKPERTTWVKIQTLCFNIISTWSIHFLKRSFFFSFLYLRQKQRKCSNSLVYFPSVCKGQGRSRCQEPGTESKSPTWVKGTQTLEPSLQCHCCLPGFASAGSWDHGREPRNELGCGRTMSQSEKWPSHWLYIFTGRVLLVCLNSKKIKQNKTLKNI